MTTVKVTKMPATGKYGEEYRITVGNNIWYDGLKKKQVFDAMEETSIELGHDGIEHIFKFEF